MYEFHSWWDLYQFGDLHKNLVCKKIISQSMYDIFIWFMSIRSWRIVPTTESCIFLAKFDRRLSFDYLYGPQRWFIHILLPYLRARTYQDVPLDIGPLTYSYLLSSRNLSRLYPTIQVSCCGSSSDTTANKINPFYLFG